MLRSQPRSNFPADEGGETGAGVSAKMSFQDHRAGPRNLDQAAVEEPVLGRKFDRECKSMQSRAGTVDSISRAKMTGSPSKDELIVVGEKGNNFTPSRAKSGTQIVVRRHSGR